MRTPIYMKIVSSSSLVKNLKPSLFCGTNHHMRVADLLIAGDDEYFCDFIVTDIAHRQRRRRRENNRNFACLSPRSILSRWLSSGKKSKSQKSLVKMDKVEREGRENVDGEFGRERKEQTKCSMKGQTGESSPSVSEELNGDCGIAEMSDRYIKEASFNLGAGFGLVYLVAASTNELSKMVELQTQREMLLQNVKEELQSQRTDTLSKTSNSIDNVAYSTIDGQESLHTNENVSLQNLTLLENTSDSETPAVCNQSLNCDTTRQERHIKEMDQLEAELEIELERLQLHLDTEVMSEHPKEQRMEMMPFEDIGPEESFSGCAEVVDEPPEDGTRKHWLVPPNELEKRLHQLVEARQQERIKELEAALECARLRLDEKEREVSLWKDTARLISQHLPDSNY